MDSENDTGVPHLLTQMSSIIAQISSVYKEEDTV